MDCRKLTPSPSGRPLTDAEKETQRREFAKDHARALTTHELKHDWTDGYGDLVLRIPEAGVTDSEISVILTGDRHLDISFPNRVFKLGTIQALSVFLAGGVVPRLCTLKLEQERVVVTLRKGKPALWDKLEGKAGIAKGAGLRTTRIWTRGAEGG